MHGLYPTRDDHLRPFSVVASPPEQDLHQSVIQQMLIGSIALFRQDILDDAPARMKKVVDKGRVAHHIASCT